MKKPKQRPYKGKDKKPITDMSERKRAALELWANYHANRKNKKRNANQLFGNRYGWFVQYIFKRL